jgi:protein-S-isoprenylcysteine O-methyltransferase Ste14
MMYEYDAVSPPAAPRSLYGHARRALLTFFAMSGWRTDHLDAAWLLGGVVSLGSGQLLVRLGAVPALTESLPAMIGFYLVTLLLAYALCVAAGRKLDGLDVAWVVGGVLSLGVGERLMARNSVPVALAYYSFTLFLYYGVNTAVLTSTLPARLIARHGEDRAYRMYETVLALMFINQGLGVGCMTALSLGPSWVLPISPGLACVVGGCFFACGLVIKVWATVLVGVDVYYYRDMFLGRPVSEFVCRGPYRVFQNPMYGVGQLHAYGYAILARSLTGLVCAMICHSLIYVFYITAERPFIRRVFPVATAD